jgi:hypothetical protein
VRAGARGYALFNVALSIVAGLLAAVAGTALSVLLLG